MTETRYLKKRREVTNNINAIERENSAWAAPSIWRS